MNSLKNSFIFLETIVSLLVVSIIVTIFFKISYNKSDNKTFNTLITLTNKLKKSQYDSFLISNKTLTIKKDNHIENLLVKEISSKEKNIKLIKYELK